MRVLTSARYVQAQSLSSIIVLLLWLYLSALILVYGAEYNIVRETARPGAAETAPGGPA